MLLGHTQCLFLLQDCFERNFGTWLFEPLRTLRGRRRKCGQCLHAQAPVQIRSQQRADPSLILAAALHTIFSGPQCDNRYEPCFMVCDHHETSSESGYLSERSMDRGGQGGVDLVRFIRFRHELNVESRDTRTGVAHTECRRSSTRPVEIEWPRCGSGKTVSLQRT
jgi:hypothetical protein